MKNVPDNVNEMQWNPFFDLLLSVLNMPTLKKLSLLVGNLLCTRMRYSPLGVFSFTRPKAFIVTVKTCC